MRYIVIHETGEVFKADKITEEDKNAFNNGHIDLIDCKKFKSYYQGD